MNLRTALFGILCFMFASPVVVNGQTGYLYKSRIPFYVDLIPFRSHKDSIPNMVSVEYQYHAGICTLKNGKVLTGWFKFDHYEPRFNFFKGTRLKRHDELLHKSNIDFLPDTVEYSSIQRLTMAGKDSSVFTGTDSTLFMFSDKLDKLIRLRAEKPVKIFDDLLIVDELNHQHLAFWTESSHVQGGSWSPVSGFGTPGTSSTSYSRAKPVWSWVDADVYRELRTTDEVYYSWQDKLIRIKSWDEAKEKFTIDPYILRVAEILKKNRPRDIAFAILYSMTTNKLTLLPFFHEAELTLADGRSVRGFGYVQPYRVNGFEKTGYLHFYDGENMKLYNPSEIESITVNHHTYKPLFDNFNKKEYLGFPWVYEGVEYLIVEGAWFEENPGFYNQGGEPRTLIMKPKKNGTYEVSESGAVRKAWGEQVNR